MARAKKIIDNSPKFDKSRYYAIGTLKQNRATTDVPEGFADNPKALHIAGTDLINAGMKSCRDFLVSSNCQFKLGSAVHFYDVEYRKEGEPLYTNIFIGSPLLSQNTEPERVLSDGSSTQMHTINNIIPNTNSTEYEKMFFKSQEEAIAYYRKCLDDERKFFSATQIDFTKKIEEYNDRILELNILINTLKAENDALRIKYEETQKFADRLERMTQKEREKEAVQDAPQGLGDKAVGMFDGMLGDGASQQLLMSLASGLGSGADKLIGLGVDLIRDKVLAKPSKQQVFQAQISPQMEETEPTEQEKIN
jgi:hypothetical protein